MTELKRIVADIESIFSDSSYPQAFLDAWDQMECLASHSGRETLLVRNKQSGEMAVAKCYDRAQFPLEPDHSFLKELSHPGLPGFLGRYQNEKMLCFVREYIEGEPLSVYARTRQLSLEQIRAVADQVAGILEVLHGHQPAIIHRDIKPENIIIRPDGRTALIDFDISRSFKADGENDTVSFGTKGFAPPEQYGFGQTDARADVYAFGVLLRWLVTGSIRENRNITIDRELQRIIDRCTAFSPDERYTGITEVRRALAAAGRRKRRPDLKALAVLLGVMLLGLAGGFAVGRYTGWFRPVPRVSFTEPLIGQAVAMQLGRDAGSLTPEDLKGVTSLYIYGEKAYADRDQLLRQTVDENAEGPLRTLDDLAMLPNLEEVYIVRQGYVDISGIAGLTHLHTAELKHMRISGLQPLAGISGLRNAVLFDAGITDASPLENCPLLETLDVGLNAIADLRHIGRHPNLRNLGLMWLTIPELDGVAERLPRLKAVMLQHGDFKDLSGLQALPELERVYVLAGQEAAVREALSGTQAEIHITEN